MKTAAVILVFFMISCGAGYKPPESLVEPDAEKCFKIKDISADSGGEIEVNQKECGSLRWSKIEFEPGSIPVDASFKLSAGSDIVNDPSFILNYSLKLELMSEQPFDFTGAVYFNVPYVYAILEEKNYGSVDVSPFYLEEGNEEPQLVSLSLSETDDEQKRIKTRIFKRGNFQPGVKIFDEMSLGEVEKINLGSSIGSFIVKASGEEEFNIMLTAMPAALFYDSLITPPSSTPFTISSSELNSNIGKLYSGYVKQEKESFVKNKQKNFLLDSLFHNKLKKRLERRKDNHFKLIKQPSGKINFDNGLIEGQRATGIYIYDYRGCVPDYYVGCEVLMPDPQEAVIHRVTDNAAVLVHDNEGSYAALTPAQIDAIDDLANSFDDNIYVRDTFFFGNPSDVDGNGKVLILLTDTLLDTGVLGFFYTVDVFENDGLPPSLGGFGDSNQADIIYATIPSDSVHELLLKATVAHEFAHLINFTNKTLNKITGGNPGVAINPDLLLLAQTMPALHLNEGFSHFAEDVAGLADVKAGIPHILNHPNDEIRPYLKNNNTSSMVDEAGGGSFAMRGQNYLFIRYLFEQAGAATQNEGSSLYTDSGGAALLKDMISSDYSGVSAIENIFPTHDPYERNFTQVYLDWLVTLYNDKYQGSLNSDSKYNYLDTYKDEINVNQTIGIDLGSTRILEDTLEEITLDGPVVNSFSQDAVIYSSSAKTLGASYVTFKLSVAPSENILRFVFSGSASGNLKGMLMRIQ